MGMGPCNRIEGMRANPLASPCADTVGTQRTRPREMEKLMGAGRRVTRLIADLARVNVRYMRSPGFRRAAMSALASPSTPLELSAAAVREVSAAPAGALPYAGVTGAALALCSLRRDTSRRETVNLLLTELDPDRLFAGVNTALLVAKGLADRLDRSLRVILLSETITAGQAPRLRAAAASRLECDTAAIAVVTREDLLDFPVHPDDLWVATHWTTAHPVQVATRIGVLAADRVVYLVQDYEPSFVAASADSVTASSTYHGGFTLLVNSSPVAAILRSREGVVVDEALVFAPQLDLARISAQSVNSAPNAVPTVFFYGRPSKPRNLFALGVAALKVAASRLPAGSVNWISAGEAHRAVALAPGHTLRSLDAVGWDDYFALLAQSRVVLSLQASPHPSHPPLEAALSGAIAITNEVDGTRSTLHPRLRAVIGDPETLGQAIVDAVTSPGESAAESHDLSALGRPLKDALDSVASRITRA